MLEKVGRHQDRQAYHALFEHFAPQIKYYTMANGMSNHAEELVQEVFVSITLSVLSAPLKLTGTFGRLLNPFIR